MECSLRCLQMPLNKKKKSEVFRRVCWFFSISLLILELGNKDEIRKKDRSVIRMKRQQKNLKRIYEFVSQIKRYSINGTSLAYFQAKN